MTSSKAYSMTKAEKLALYLRLPENDTTSVDEHIDYSGIENALTEAGRVFREAKGGTEDTRSAWTLRKPSRRIAVIVIAALVILLILAAACVWTGFLLRALNYGKRTSINSVTLPSGTKQKQQTNSQESQQEAPVNKDPWQTIRQLVSFKLYKPTYIPPGFEYEKFETNDKVVDVYYKNNTTEQEMLIYEGPDLGAVGAPDTTNGQWYKAVSMPGDDNACLMLRKASPDFMYSTYTLNWYPYNDGTVNTVGIVFSSNSTYLQSVPDALSESDVLKIGNSFVVVN